MDSNPNQVQPTQKKNNSKEKKILIGIATGLAIIALGIFIFIKFLLTPLVKDKIINSIYSSSNGLYTLEIDKFELHFWRGAIHMENLNLKQDSIILKRLQKEDPIANYSKIHVKMNSVDISRIWWRNYLFNKSLEVGKVVIDGPRFFFKGKVPEDTLKLGKQSFLELLPGLIAGFAGSLKIKEFTVVNGKFKFDLESKKGMSKQKADSIFVHMESIRIDTAAPRNVLYTDHLHFSLNNYELLTDDHLYKLNIGKFTGSYADSALKIDNISFKPQKPIKGGDHYEVEIESIVTRQIDFPLFIRDKKVSLGKMVINSPKINIAYHAGSNVAGDTNSDGSMINRSFLQVALPYVANTFKMSQLTIKNGDINSSLYTKSGLVQQKAKNIEAMMKKIVIDTATTKNGNYWSDINISFTNYESKIQSLNLKLNINSLKATSTTNNVRLLGMVASPLHGGSGKDDRLFFKNFTKSIEMIDVDFHRLFYGSGLSMKKMNVNGTSLEIYHNGDEKGDKAYTGRMPHELMALIPIYLRIDQMHISNAYLKYEEKSSEIEHPGILTFENINLSVTNLTNDPKRMSISNPAILEGSTKVMGQGLLTLKVKVPLLSKNFDAVYTGSLGEMDAKYFNSFLQYAGMKLESGTIEAQKIRVTVNNGVGSGDMLLIYHSLNTKLINKKTGKVKKFLSHIANFVLKDENKKAGPKDPKVVTVHYSRSSEDDIVSYLWNCINGAIIDTVVKDFFGPFVKGK